MPRMNLEGSSSIITGGASGIGEASARLECGIRQVVELGTPGLPFGEVHLVVAEVVWVWFDDAVLNEAGRIDPLRLAPVSRLGLRSFLNTVPEGIYSLPRMSAEEYAALEGDT